MDASTEPTLVGNDAPPALSPGIALAGRAAGAGDAESDQGRTEAGPAAAGAGTLRTDSLGAGVAMLLGLAAAQRLVGLVRNVLFCGLLSDDQLGRWSLAMVFLVLAAPLAVLGLPGSFGRYVEHYRRRGMLPAMLRTTAAASGAGALFFLTVLWAAPGWFASLVFGDAQYVSLMRAVTAALAAVILLNFLTELFTALRQPRMATWMQLGHSLSFAAVSLGLLWTTELGEQAVVWAFGAGALLAAVPALVRLRAACRQLPRGPARLPGRDLWSRLAPFAAWIWISNLVGNLFEGADQYMIVHVSGLPAQTAESWVGQYHASRVIPVLFVSLAAMFAALLLPYLAADWEAGRRREARATWGLSFKLASLALTGAGVLVVATVPVLFRWLLDDRYDRGLAVLPWTTAYCAWYGLTLISQTYLWCVERARLSGLGLALGLACNVVLNAVLLPRFGLPGAVWATAAANAAALALVLAFSGRQGLRLDGGVWAAAALPAALAGGPGLAAAAWTGAVWLSTRGAGWFTADERRVLQDGLQSLRLRAAGTARNWGLFGSDRPRS